MLDISNTFMQTDVWDKDSEKIIMKIRGSLVGILLEIDKDKHEDFIIYFGKNKLLYAKILKVLHDMLMASILHYKNFRKDINTIGHKANPCNIYIASKIINSK